MQKHCSKLLFFLICSFYGTLFSQNLTVSSPTAKSLGIDQSGNLSLPGYVFPDIDSIQLRRTTWRFTDPYFPPRSLRLKSPEFRLVNGKPTENRIWSYDGKLYLQGSLSQNVSSLPSGYQIKNNAGLSVAVFTSDGSLYLKGNIIHQSGCTPAVWESAKWNDGEVQPNNNCYNYGNNQISFTFAQPGRASGSNQSNTTVNGCIANATADGLSYLGMQQGTCGSGQHLAALAINPGADYHWYRKDSNGTWSHKPGSTAATNKDNSGNTITNPETADRGGYTSFAGYFCTCGNNANIR